MASERVANATTALFVPGDRPERFGSAQSSGADIVIVDWEDAVADEDKATARTATIEGLRAASVPVLIRVNATDSPEHEADLRALAELRNFDGVVVADARSAADLDSVIHLVPAEGALIAFIESALGVRDAESIAASPGVTRIALGAVDLALDLGTGADDRFLDYSRSRIVVASRAAEIAAPLDSPSLELRDPDAVAAAAQLSQGFGFGGKLCIHPNQVQAVRRGFAPTDEQRAWAAGIIGMGNGAAAVDGMMVDKPVVERARRIMARVRISGRQ